MSGTEPSPLGAIAISILVVLGVIVAIPGVAAGTAGPGSARMATELDCTSQIRQDAETMVVDHGDIYRNMSEKMYDSGYWIDLSFGQAEELLQILFEHIYFELAKEVLSGAIGITAISTAVALMTATKIAITFIRAMHYLDISELLFEAQADRMVDAIDRLEENTESLDRQRDVTGDGSFTCADKRQLFSERKRLLEEAYAQLADHFEFEAYSFRSRVSGEEVADTTTYNDIRGLVEITRAVLVLDYHETTSWLKNRPSGTNLAKATGKSIAARSVGTADAQLHASADTLETTADYTLWQVAIPDEIPDDLDDFVVVVKDFNDADDVRVWVAEGSPPDVDSPGAGTRRPATIAETAKRLDWDGIQGGETFYVLVKATNATSYLLGTRVGNRFSLTDPGDPVPSSVVEQGTLQPSPDPAIESVSMRPDQVEVGQNVTVEVTVTNRGGTADWQSVAIGLPGLSGTGSVSVVDHDLERASIVDAGFTAGARYGHGETTLGYPLVEASSTDWATGETHRLTIRVQATEAGQLPIEVKSVVQADGVWTGAPAPGTGSVDQQGESVETRDVTVGEPTQTGLSVSPSAWDIGSISSDATRETTVTLQNTGDVTTDVSITGGPGLTVSSVPDQLAPGESGTFTARLEASGYTGDSIVVSYAGGRTVVPISVTVVKDEEHVRSATEGFSDENFCWMVDVWGPDSGLGCDGDFSREWVDNEYLDGEAYTGLIDATLDVEFATDPPDDAQDDPLEVYVNGDRVATLDSPPGGGEMVTHSISVPKSALQQGDNEFRMKVGGSSSYDIGRGTELRYSYLEEVDLQLDIGDHPTVVEPGTSFRVPVTISNEGGQTADNVILGLGGGYDTSVIQVVKWPDGYGLDDGETLVSGQSDVRYFEFRLKEPSAVSIELAAGSSTDYTDRSFTIRPPNDPPTLSDVGLTPAEDVAGASFDYRASVADPDGDELELTIEVYDPSAGSWRGIGTQRVVGEGTASWQFAGFDAADEGAQSRFRVAYDDGHGHTGTWGPFAGPTVVDDDTSGPSIGAIDRPSVVAADEPIPVTATVTDDSGVSDVILRYTYANGTGGTVGMVAAGDGYRASVPPAGTANAETSVFVSIRATDGDDTPLTTESTERSIRVNSPPDHELIIATPASDDRATIPADGTGSIDVSGVLEIADDRVGSEDVRRVANLSTDPPRFEVTVAGTSATVVDAEVGEPAIGDDGTVRIDWSLSLRVKSIPDGVHDLSVSVALPSPCWPDVASECAAAVTELTATAPSSAAVGEVPDQPTPSASARWALDDAGPTVPDRSGHGHDGSVQGSPERVSGVVGSSYRFDGEDDFVMVDMTERLQTTGSFTLSMWVRPTEATAAAGQSTALGLYTYNGNGRGEGVRINVHRSRVNYQARHSDGFGQPGGGAQNDPYYHIPGESVPLTTGEWHHVALRYDADAETIALFVNGTEAASLAAPKPPRVDDTYLLIGARPASDGGDYPDQLALSHFAGDIDEVRIYHRALADSALSGLAEPTESTPTGTPPSPTAPPPGDVPDTPTRTAPPTPTRPTVKSADGAVPIDEGDVEAAEDRIVELPGFTPLTAVLALLVAAVLFRRRRD